MPATFVTLIAIGSAAAFLGLWFWVVRRELTRARGMVESAKIQVLACRKKCVQVGEDGDEAARTVLLRSETNYHQSVVRYGSVLKRPWNYVPGRLMGFGAISEWENEGHPN